MRFRFEISSQKSRGKGERERVCVRKKERRKEGKKEREESDVYEKERGLERSFCVNKKEVEGAVKVWVCDRVSVIAVKVRERL